MLLIKGIGTCLVHGKKNGEKYFHLLLLGIEVCLHFLPKVVESLYVHLSKI